MSAVLSIAAREIRERRFLLAAAFVAGLLPIAASLVLRLPQPEDYGTVAVFVGIAFLPAVALAVGGSIVGRDIAEGRLAFYLARPISTLALWAGKFLGGAVLVGLTLVLVVLPYNLAEDNPRRWLAEKYVPEPLVIGSAMLLVLMVGAHVAASLYRSRSAWIALDFVLLAVAIGAVRELFGWALDTGAGQILFERVPLLLLATAGGGLAASAAQLAVGRADPARGRRVLSWAWWSGVAVVLLCTGAWVRWVLGTTPAETGLTWGCFAAPRGSGISFVSGVPGRGGYRPVFFMDAASGSFASFSQERGGVPRFTADGRRAVWIAGPPELRQWESAALVTARFEGGAPRLDEVSLTGRKDSPSVLHVDGEGRRALVAGTTYVEVLDTASGATLARLDMPAPLAGEFLDGFIRVAGNAGDIVIADWTPRDGSRVERVRIQARPRESFVTLSGRMALATPDGIELLLVDVEKGTQRPLRREPGARRGSAWSARAIRLEDGSLAIACANLLWLAPPQGEVREIGRLGPNDGIFRLVQTSATELALGVSTRGVIARRTLFVDLATGAVRREEGGLVPAAESWRDIADGPAPGSLGSRLFVTEDDALVELLADGARRVVVPAVAEE